MAAFCMAVYFRGLSERETYVLTDAMIRSGETIDLGAALGRKVVDKHSTGGVGDKTSLAVAPIVAACGVPLGKMSGRGLGHTGGTLDKLESIPGYRTELSLDEFIAQVRDVGAAIIGQTGDLVPADKLLYSLRDVTATVDQLSLIAASIMSKKLAGGAQAIVLDVKVGNGAFMKSVADARRLAETMISLGQQAGREVVCLLTDMDQPLGAAVGNSLEVLEALETVRGRGPADFTELVLDACGRLLAFSDLGIDEAEGRRRAEAAVADGSAEATWRRWIEAQGGTSDESRSTGCPDRAPGDGPDAPASSASSSRSPSGTPPSISARGGAPRKTASITQSVSSAMQSEAPGSRRAMCSPRCTHVPRLRQTRRSARSSRRTSSATKRRQSARCCSKSSTRDRPVRCSRARAARGRDRSPPARARARRPVLRARRDHRSAADPSARADRGGRRAPGRAGRARRSSRQISDCSVRVGSRAPRSPPDDGVVSSRAWRDASRRSPPTRCCHARRRIGRCVPRCPPLRHLAPARAV